MKKRNPVPRIRTTYRLFTPSDDPDIGYEEESGWEDEDGEEMDLDDDDEEGDVLIEDTYARAAYRWLQGKGFVEPSSSNFHYGVWYSTIDDEIDFRTGERKQYSFHLVDFSPLEEDQIFHAIKNRRAPDPIKTKGYDKSRRKLNIGPRPKLPDSPQSPSTRRLNIRPLAMLLEQAARYIEAKLAAHKDE